MDKDQAEKNKCHGKNGNSDVKPQTTENKTDTEEDLRLSVNEGHNRAGFICGIPC